MTFLNTFLVNVYKIRQSLCGEYTIITLKSITIRKRALSPVAGLEDFHVLFAHTRIMLGRVALWQVFYGFPNVSIIDFIIVSYVHISPVKLGLYEGKIQTEWTRWCNGDRLHMFPEVPGSNIG
jgi:hypothetical protein